MQSGMSSYRRELQGAGRDQGILDKQMRAFGTTLRYALAGGVLFGTMQAIRTLGDFQQKLGQISAIGSSDKFPLVGRQLDQLGASLLRISTETVTPIGELQDAVTNLYSTVDGLSPDQAVNTIETIAKVARISQADITDTTQAVLGMVNAFDKGMKNVPSIGDQFFQVTKYASGGLDFSRTYAQQLGKLSQTAKLGDFSLEEMSAIAIAGSKFSGSPATNLRGQAQLQRTVKNPSNAKSEPFYNLAGVSKSQRLEMSGYDVLMKLLTYANSLTEGGKGAFMSGAFTRAESRNIATVLSYSMTPDQIAKGSERKTLGEYLRLSSPEVRATESNQAFERYMKMASISQSGKAMQDFSIAFANSFNPLIQPAASGLTKGSLAFQGFAKDNPEAVMGITGAVGAGLVAARMYGKRVPLRALPMAGAAADVLQGGAMRGDSPMNPLYVIVVAELLGRGSGGWKRGVQQYPGPIGPMNRPGTAGGMPAPSKWSRLTGSLPAVGYIGATALGAYLMQKASQDENLERQGGHHPILDSLRNKKGGIRIPGLFNPMGGGGFGGFNIGGSRTQATPEQAAILDRLKRGYINEQSAERMLEKVSPRLKASESLAVGEKALKISGNATVTVNVDQTDAKGNVTRKVTKVPLPLFGQFTAPAPQTAGKNKTTRGK